MKIKLKDNSGFTLMELLVVIAVIGLLASLIIVANNNARVRARDTIKLRELKAIQTAIDLYFDANGFYPMGNDPNVRQANTNNPGTWNHLATLLSPYMVLPTPENPLYSYSYYHDFPAGICTWDHSKSWANGPKVFRVGKDGYMLEAWLEEPNSKIGYPHGMFGANYPMLQIPGGNVTYYNYAGSC